MTLQLQTSKPEQGHLGASCAPAQRQLGAQLKGPGKQTKRQLARALPSSLSLTLDDLLTSPPASRFSCLEAALGS